MRSSTHKRDTYFHMLSEFRGVRFATLCVKIIWHPPLCEFGLAFTPVCEVGLAFTPVCEVGLASTPVCEIGLSSTPVCQIGLASTPVCEIGLAFTQGMHTRAPLSYTGVRISMKLAYLHTGPQCRPLLVQPGKLCVLRFLNKKNFLTKMP
jgi:hypothetical protein